ncbi:ribosomal RNA processing protein 36 homolog [Diretmus argenteus]
MSSGAKKAKQKGVAVMKKGGMASSSDEDSDVETNFALLTQRGRGGGSGEGEEGASYSRGQEAEDFSDHGEEEEGSDVDGDEEGEGSDVDEDEEEEEEEGSDVDEDEEGEGPDGGDEEELEGEEDGDSEGSEEEEEEDVQPGGDDGGGIQTRDDIKKELSTMSFEDIMKLQNKVGTKTYNEVAYGTSKTPQNNRKKKRLNKNRPMEISAKRPAPFLRQVVSVKKTILRDPRFDDLSGEYKPEIFEKTYKFINDIKQREREIVQKQLKKTKPGNQKKEQLQGLLKRMENQERARKSREQQREKELELKRKQREMAGQGLKPFFLKNSDKKKLQLADKYNELKKSGKLESFLSKKRKRNAGKDRRKLPPQQH